MENFVFNYSCSLQEINTTPSGFCFEYKDKKGNVENDKLMYKSWPENNLTRPVLL